MSRDAFFPTRERRDGKRSDKKWTTSQRRTKNVEEKHTPTERERKRSRQRVVVNVVVVETNANVLSRKETKRGTANPNDQSRTTTTTTTTKDIYPTALSRPYFLDTINIVSVYPQLIYTSYPIAIKVVRPHNHAQHASLCSAKEKKRHIHHARVVMSRLVFFFSSMIIAVSPTTTTFRRRRRRGVFQRRNNDASRVVLVVSPKAAAAETTTQTSSSLEERVATVPYFNDAREKRVLVGKAGSELVERRNCRDFIALPNEENSSALVKLRETIDEGWQSGTNCKDTDTPRNGRRFLSAQNA